MKSTYRRFNRRLASAFVLGVSFFAIFAAVFAFAYNSQLSRAEEIANGSQVEENSILKYFLTIKYDGVDKNGVKSDDTKMSNIASGIVEVTDKIPDGLEFIGFEATESGTIGAVSRFDSEIFCSGHVIDDTNEDDVADGVWNKNNTEYTYHGLHYNAKTRTVSFMAEDVKAGCNLTVGIIVKTPLLTKPTRLDFFNTAIGHEGSLRQNSNTVHVWIGRGDVTRYNVSYRYTGDVIPENAPDVSVYGGQYAAGITVGVATGPDIDGYTFSGWDTDGPDIANDSFVMPSQDVELVGSFIEEDEATEYKVTYIIEGEAPEGYLPPKEKYYEAGDVVILDSTKAGSKIDDFTFNGWYSETVELEETGFIMPAADVVIIGTFTQKKYTVHYEFEGAVLPPNWEDLLPEDEQYPAGVTVKTADNPKAANYRFTGWYKNSTFVMPAADVTILGEWSEQAGVFEPEITKTVIDKLDVYRVGSTVEFMITVKNTADFEINSVQILEKLDGVTFLAGDNYELKTPQFAFIPIMAAGETITIKAKFLVTENVDKHWTNVVVLSGALADNGWNLNTDKDYTATAEFDTESWQELPVLTGIFTNGTTFYVALMLIGVIGIGACVVIKEDKNKERKL